MANSPVLSDMSATGRESFSVGGRASSAADADKRVNARALDSLNLSSAGKDDPMPSVTESMPGTTAQQEEWRPVVGYEGCYEVSDQGRVRSSRDGHGTYVGRVRKPRSHRGYLRVALFEVGAIGTDYFVHVLVASAFLGERLGGYEVNHKDGNKHNNALDNLEYVTRSENKRHALRMGLIASGQRHRCAVLTDQQVVQIRRDVASGMPKRAVVRQLHEQSGVSETSIYEALSGRSWKWLVEA